MDIIQCFYGFINYFFVELYRSLFVNTLMGYPRAPNLCQKRSPKIRGKLARVGAVAGKRIACHPRAHKEHTHTTNSCAIYAHTKPHTREPFFLHEKELSPTGGFLQDYGLFSRKMDLFEAQQMCTAQGEVQIDQGS